MFLELFIDADITSEIRNDLQIYFGGVVLICTDKLKKLLQTNQTFQWINNIIHPETKGHIYSRGYVFSENNYLRYRNKEH